MSFKYWLRGSGCKGSRVYRGTGYMAPTAEGESMEHKIENEMAKKEA